MQAGEPGDTGVQSAGGELAGSPGVEQTDDSGGRKAALSASPKLTRVNFDMATNTVR